MKDIEYTSEELELLEYMETNPKSVSNVEDEISKITDIVKDNVRKRKQVNFRLNDPEI